MDDDLYSDNQQLRRQLKAFLSQARSNEQKMRRFQEQELQLIRLSSLVQLINTIIYDYRSAFDLDVVSLILIDPSYEIQHIVEDEDAALADHPELVFVAVSDKLDALYGLAAGPLLGQYRPVQHEFLFSEHRRKPASVALMPLVRYDTLIGSLNLGSFKDERFVEGSATDFLQRLSAVVAICLENAANHERLKRVGLTDFLTGINNRRFFDQRLSEEVMRTQRQAGMLGCLLLDIDNFKSVNDTYGHRVGDQVLKEVSAMAKEQLRGSDVLARFGGEEFSILLIDSEKPITMDIAERIRRAIASHSVQIDGDQSLQVTVSIGVSMFDGGAFNRDSCELSETLVDHADQALYQAKSDGKNQVVCFES
ncbi:diguanylate cyclase/phosphodiesterase (GGDEF & EAL domains) with PAS/PAC sensor(s) [hydrothermal vent metagenome]|uniref:Diguanylate cyclase/phosphodiesterase (GGDEF & EAL domains) with PAS/PAC sensor(S) n=1 Tax=hydrothermal vent metagenome TaxID=652676 RepID=A0A3B1BLW8_9ZZZZ